MAIVRIRATAGRWTRAGDCEDWSAACLTFLTLDAAERAQRPADESVLRRLLIESLGACDLFKRFYGNLKISS
jgi:hypothetical protein